MYESLFGRESNSFLQMAMASLSLITRFRIVYRQLYRIQKTKKQIDLEARVDIPNSLHIVVSSVNKSQGKGHSVRFSEKLMILIHWIETPKS